MVRHRYRLGDFVSALGPCAIGGSKRKIGLRPNRRGLEVGAEYNRPFPFHRLMLRRTQRRFPFGAGVVLINSDGVGNLKVAVDAAIEAGCIAGMAKLRRYGFADWANEGHRFAVSTL